MTTTIDRPIRFTGTEEERQANRATHHFVMTDPEEPYECIDCASREYHAAADYPCGVEPPREVVVTGAPKPCPVSTRQFTWLADQRTYVGEISSTYGLGRVYDDACDEGLTLVSAKTGREVVFVVTETGVREGEIFDWTLRPAYDKYLDVTIKLLND